MDLTSKHKSSVFICEYVSVLVLCVLVIVFIHSFILCLKSMDTWCCMIMFALFYILNYKWLFAPRKCVCVCLSWDCYWNYQRWWYVHSFYFFLLLWSLNKLNLNIIIYSQKRVWRKWKRKTNSILFSCFFPKKKKKTKIQFYFPLSIFLDSCCCLRWWSVSHSVILTFLFFIFHSIIIIIIMILMEHEHVTKKNFEFKNGH